MWVGICSAVSDPGKFQGGGGGGVLLGGGGEVPMSHVDYTK